MLKIQHFFDARTSTLTYVVHDPDARVAVVIDPVLDFEPASGRVFTESLDSVSAFLESNRLSVPFVVDTHAHADHLSAMALVRERHGARSVIGARITAVQRVFREIFHLGDDLPVDGSQFDVLVEDGETLDLGAFALHAIHTPGHTPACMSYRVGDALFVGDTLFQPDYGTARCDFPGGSAETLHASILRLYRTLPGKTRVFTCHDYQPGGRPVAFESTLAEQRRANVQLREDTSRDAFAAFRRERDAGLAMPALILPSIQVNIRAGRLPAPEANGIAYLKIPINAFGAGARAVSFERVTPDAVRTRLAGYRIVDVREPHELEGPLGRIEGAVAIPLGEVESRAGELLGERPVLFVCRSGKRSASACERLGRRGGRSANLEGGIIAWQRAGLPVVRTSRESGSAILESLAVWLAQVTGETPAAGRAVVETMLRATRPGSPNGASSEGGASDASDAKKPGPEPTRRAVLAVLDALEARLRASGPPADHELAFAAFRRDAAALTGE